ncbi:hypothetical protein BMG03_20020 (plasmid) [Thioclava nitratireducens]|uniref:HTH gntR-type domain-containing protein n=1 Tax=Thioclava nitratireducens TaxID=1915078 RepID=A0ABM6IMP9_9RHOB|nr:GntR family transcriptional regulator [Thioclava nitratireducens]AQS50188.1 hypothetical protein BMG03_20020 [Thioclava nitratireducens]
MSKTKQAFEVLQRMIEHGDLHAGTMVSESKLVELTGLGRTPIREAIHRLALGHMIRIHPSKGLEIPTITVEDQLNALEVRRDLELLAVRLACERKTESQRAAMIVLSNELRGEYALHEYTETVRETHALIIEATHNPYLGTSILPLQALSRRFWITHIRDARREINRGREFHRNLLSAVCDGDVGSASAASRALNDYLVEFALAVVSAKLKRSTHCPPSAPLGHLS